MILLKIILYIFSKKDLKIRGHKMDIISTFPGVPRGIGISAYLSELFMRNVDNQIQELDDLIYYARYVDDIIAIFVPQI